MTFNAASYFAGVGTVLAMLTLGFGGGVLMSGVFADKTPREASKVERQMADKAKPEAPPITRTPVVVPTVPHETTAAALEPQKEPVPPATPPLVQVPVVQVQPQPQPQPVQPQPQPQVIQVTPQPPPALGRDRPVALVHPAIREHDGKDLRRQAVEKRRAEREQRRAERGREREMKEAARRQQREAQASAQRSRQAEADDDEREERPFFTARPRMDFPRADFPRPRLFPFFSHDD